MAAARIGSDLHLLTPSTAAALVAAGMVSVLVFPPVALQLLTEPTDQPRDQASSSSA